MAERKKKAAEQAATATKEKSTRGRKPAAAKVEQVEKPIEKPVEKTEASIYKVECKTVLNVRSGAGKQFAIIRQIPNASDVAVYEQADGWGRIGPDEWVMMQFLK